MDILSMIIFGMGIAVILNLIARTFHIPQIIGYILTGTILISLFDMEGARDSYGLHQIAEFGIVFLMFMIGLEFSADKVKSMKKEILIYGHTQIALTTLVFFLIAHYGFEIELKSAIIIANALALSSTAIVLKNFKESKEIYTPHGKNVLGILIFQDLAIIPMLLMIATFTAAEVDVSILIFETFMTALGLILFLLYPGRWMISYLLEKAASTRMDEIFVGTMLFIVMGTSKLAHDVGFSYSLGAFVAGLIIAETRYKYQAEADLTHFRDLLLGVFFVTVGMQIDVGFLVTHLLDVGALLVGVLLLKAVIIFSIIRMFHTKTNAVKTGIALSQVGELSFVIFELSRASGFLAGELHQLLVLVVVFSMIVTPFMLKYLDKMSAPFCCETEEYHDGEGKSLHDHVVVFGYGNFGERVVAQLNAQGISNIAIDNDKKQIDKGAKAGERVLYGNITQKSIIEQLNIADAAAVIIVLSDYESIRLACESILSVHEGAHLIVKVSGEEDQIRLADLNIHRFIQEKDEIARMLVEEAVYCDVDLKKE